VAYDLFSTQGVILRKFHRARRSAIVQENSYLIHKLIPFGYCKNKLNNYPNLHTIRSPQEKINYIRQVNTVHGIQQCKNWLAIINQNNIFLEIYERKVMNPSYIKDLLSQQTEDMNIDLFMKNYLQYL
jgi:hypothetical protein